MKRIKKKAKRYMKICPKCKSPDVNIDKNPLQPAYGLPAFYICDGCGFSSYLFPEVEVDRIEAFEKRVDEEQLRDLKRRPAEQVDRAYGNFFVDVIWKYGGPLAMLAGVVIIFDARYLGAALLVGGALATFLALRKKKR